MMHIRHVKWVSAGLCTMCAQGWGLGQRHFCVYFLHWETVWCDAPLCTALDRHLASFETLERGCMEGRGKTAEAVAQEEEGKAESAGWVKAKPGNQDCLDWCHTTADNGRVSSLSTLLFPHLWNLAPLSQGRYIEEVFWAPLAEPFLCRQGALIYFQKSF